MSGFLWSSVWQIQASIPTQTPGCVCGGICIWVIVFLCVCVFVRARTRKGISQILDKVMHNNSVLKTKNSSAVYHLQGIYRPCNRSCHVSVEMRGRIYIYIYIYTHIEMYMLNHNVFDGYDRQHYDGA